MADGTPTEVSVANLSALQLVQAARAEQTDQAGTGGVVTVGPSVADLQRIDPRLVVQVGDDPNHLAVNLATIAGMAWAAAAEVGDRVAALETRVRALENQLAEFR